MGFRGPARDHARHPGGLKAGEKTAGQGWIGWADGWRTNSIGSLMRRRIGANRGRNLLSSNQFQVFSGRKPLGVAPWRRSLAGDGLEMVGLSETR